MDAMAAAIVGQQRAGQGKDILAGHFHRARCRRATFGIDPEQRLQRDALAGPRLSENAEDFTRHQGETYAIDGVRRRNPVERDGEVFDDDDCFAHAAAAIACE